MGATLLLLLCVVVASALASGTVLTILFIIIYVFASYEFPPVSLLRLILGSSTIGILGIIAWGERRAPDYVIPALGATRVDQEGNSELFAKVRLLAQQADISVPSIYITPTETPISLTTGFGPENARLVVSEGLLDLLEDEELEAVVAHELAHVKNRDTSIMTVATLPIAAADRVVTILTGKSRGVDHGQPSRVDYADALMTAGFAFFPPLWFCGYLLWASLSRTREFTADRGAIAMTGNPAALATALRKIDETIANQPTTDFRQIEVLAFAIVETDRTTPVGALSPIGRPLTELFATHPSTSTRIERLQRAARELETPADSEGESN
jgi:heat shock protein HtpX